MDLHELERKLSTLVHYAKTLGFDTGEIGISPILDVNQDEDRISIDTIGFRVNVDLSIVMDEQTKQTV